MTADIFDSLNAQTIATGNWGKSGPPKLQPYKRPTDVPATAKSGGVKALFARFQRK